MLVDVLVGRDHVLSSVEAQLDAVRYGTPARALVISGPGGSGRTSVLLAAAARAAREGWAVGMSAVGAQDTLAAALDRALESALRQCPPGAGFALLSGARRRFVQEAAASPFDLSDALSQLLPVLAAAPGVPRVAVFLDDLHHATPAACRALLEGLATMAGTGAPVGLIPSYATGEADALPDVQPDQIENHHLAPLGAEDLEQLAIRFGLALDPQAVEALHRSSAGSPRDAVAILQRVRDVVHPAQQSAPTHDYPALSEAL